MVRERDSVSPERRAEFEWYRCERPRMLRAMVDRIGLPRFCPRPGCLRSGGCVAADPGPCLWALFAACGEQEHLIFQVAIGLRVAGGEPGRAWQEAERLVGARLQSFAEPARPAPVPQPVLAVSAPPPLRKARRIAAPPPPPDEAIGAAQVRQAREADRDGGFLSRPGRALSPARRR